MRNTLSNYIKKSTEHMHLFGASSMVIILIHLGSLFSICNAISAQNINHEKLDSLFILFENNQKGMGSISIYENGKEVYLYSMGYAIIEENIRATAKTKYRIGSITKTFTATIIMKLIEEEKLTLDTKLSTFFPQVKNSQDITIEQMLRHRSGIFNFTNALDYTTWMEQKISRDDLIKKIISHGSTFLPDEKAEYSNSNYVLLSLIAEKIAETDYNSLLQNIICLPCELNSTYVGSKISVKDDEALSYRYLEKWNLASETNMSIPMGAGAIVSTPTDLNKFINCLFDTKIVFLSTLEKMTTIQDEFGIGLLQIPFYNKRAYGHSGVIDGFMSSTAYFPNEKVAISYISNGVVTPINDILIGVLSIYFNKEYLLPTFSPILELSSEELEKYLGVYASTGFPLKITITKNNNVLIAQATGQSAFPLDAYEHDIFKFDAAGIVLEFDTKKNNMTLKQGGGA